MLNLVFLSFLATALGAATPGTPQPTIKWTNCSKNVPGPELLDPSTIDLTNIPSTLHCGEIDVPMDYAKPMCEGNQITLGVAMHRPANPKGLLFFNPGGSDPAVIFAWQTAYNLTNEFEGLLDFDILVVDLRGTFSSNPLNVSLGTFTGLLGEYPRNQSAFDVAKETSSKIIQSWIDNSSPPGIIEFVGLREVVQDYERIRQALGYEKVNFLGASRGTMRAADYAARFPERVGNFVLDAVVPHTLGIYEQAQTSMAALNRAMLRIDAYCQLNTSCPFHAQGKRSVITAFKNTLATAKETPYPLPPTENCLTCTQVTDLDIRTVMMGSFLGVVDFEGIISGINNTLYGGDASYFMNGPPTVEGVVAMPLLCGDYDYDRSFEAFDRSLEEGLKNDETGIALTLPWQIQLWCLAWPFAIPEQPKFPISEKVLLVTDDFDAGSPIEWTFSTRDNELPNSTLVVRHGDNHVSLSLTNQLSTKTLKDFLHTGILPTAFNSTYATIYTPDMKIGEIVDPYAVDFGGDV